VEVWSVVFFVIAILLVISEGSERGQCEKRYRKLEKKYNELAIRTGNPELVTTFISEKDLDAIRQLKAQNKIVQAVKLTRTLEDLFAQLVTKLLALDRTDDAKRAASEMSCTFFGYKMLCSPALKFPYDYGKIVKYLRA
jgi:hypothetical protein